MIPKSPPAGLRATRLRVGGERVYLFTYPAPGEPAQDLSRAETAVVRLLLEGLTRAEIARRRRVSASTVNKQVESAFKKLGVGSRSELAARLLAGASA